MNNYIDAQRGRDTVGLVLYLFGPGRFNEHSDQRVIAAAETLDVPDGTRLDINDDEDREQILVLGREMDSHRKAMKVDKPGGHVWHCSIALPPGEYLTDTQWAEAARLAVRRLGFDDSSGKAPCRWLAVHHGQSINGNEHIHVVVNLVREDGTFASTSNERRTMSRVCAELERRFGLRVVEGRVGAGMPGLSRAELERTAREGKPEPDRIRLARIVRGCAVAAESEADFVRRLRRRNVVVRPRYAPGGHNVVGYSVALRPDPAKDKVAAAPIWFGGGRLARDLTLPRLREHWKTSPAAAREALAEWRRQRTGQSITRPGHATTYPAASWAQAAAVVDRVRAELATVASDDFATWAGVAREAAGVLAAWSSRLEVRTPGPLAAAADALARSAQTPIGRPRAHRVGRVKDLRGVAMVAAAASRDADSLAGQRMLLRQIIRLMNALSRVHQARGQAHQAAMLAEAACAGLARMQHHTMTASTSARAVAMAPPAPRLTRPPTRPPRPGTDVER